MAWMWSAFLPDFGMLNPRAPFSDDMTPLRRSTVLLATPARTACTHQGGDTRTIVSLFKHTTIKRVLRTTKSAASMKPGVDAPAADIELECRDAVK